MERVPKQSPETVTLRTGKKLSCAACGGDQFLSRKVLLTPPGTTVFQPQSFDEPAQCWVCAACDCIHWFQIERR